MNQQEIRKAVVDALRTVAPESDPQSLADDARLRDELDLDSMDFLNFVVALDSALHVAVPEADYPKVQTMGAAVAYLAAKLDATR